jgi:HEAT repeat protein
MKLRIIRILIGVTVGLVLVAGTIWVLIKTLGDREPRFSGKLLDYWAEQSNSTNAAAREQARSVLEKEILPQLTQIMFCDTNDSKLRLNLIGALNGLPGVVIYFTDADGRRARAATSLGEFGPAGSPAIPVLIQAANSKDIAVRGPALGALGQIHQQPDVIVPLLMKYLDDDNLNTPAAEALGGFGSAAKLAVPKLVALLKIHDKDLRHAVTESLKKIDPEAAAQAGIRR